MFAYFGIYSRSLWVLCVWLRRLRLVYCHSINMRHKFLKGFTRCSFLFFPLRFERYFSHRIPNFLPIVIQIENRTNKINLHVYYFCRRLSQSAALVTKKHNNTKKVPARWTRIAICIHCNTMVNGKTSSRQVYWRKRPRWWGQCQSQMDDINNKK